jgi:hypothetical protein
MGSHFCQQHGCGFHLCSGHIYEYNDEDGGYRSDFCYKHDLLNNLCQRYGFDLSNNDFKKICEDPDCVGLSNVLLKEVMTLIARKAIMICESKP